VFGEKSAVKKGRLEASGELKSIPELISFGLELGLNPSEIKKIFNSIKDIKPAGT
jgi:hypothetical protein